MTNSPMAVARAGAARSLLRLLALGVAFGCGPGEPANGPAPEQSIRVVEGERASDEHPDARLAIEAPRPGSALAAEAARNGEEAAVRFRLESFRLREHTPGVEERGIAITEDGQHLHVIVNDRPYEAIYDISDPVALEDLEPGVHVVRAFPSRSWHESVKTRGAFALTWFTVGPAEDVAPLDPDAPLLTYSRPMGSYEGSDADSVMVDFYLTNVELSDGHAVRLSVNGEAVREIDRWVPHYILGLPAGEHRIRLELLDAEGAPVPGPFNVAEQVITVER